jgi:PAS domain-containing protein
MAARRHERGAAAPWRPANIPANQRLLHLVLDTLPVGVVVIDLAGDILLANPALSRIWGGKIDSGKERYEKSKGFRHGTGERLKLEEWASVRALVKGETSLDELIDIETYDGHRKTTRPSSAPSSYSRTSPSGSAPRRSGRAGPGSKMRWLSSASRP